MGALHATTLYYGTLYCTKQLELNIFILLCKVKIQWALDLKGAINQSDIGGFETIQIYSIVLTKYCGCEEVYSYLTFIYSKINDSI